MKAAEWFRRGADNGDLASEVEYAILLFNGTGVTKDERSAARYFLHAASRGNAIAQNRVARLYTVGRGVNEEPRRGRRPGTSPPPDRGCPMRGWIRRWRGCPAMSAPGRSGSPTSAIEQR